MSYSMGAKVAKVAKPYDRKPKSHDDPRAVETLVRQLVARAQLATPIPAPPGTHSEREPTESESEVLVDLEVDGVRCVLARTHTSSADELRLSPREREVARMIAKGYPNKIIASVLDISVWTVSTHLRRIFAKLGVTSRTAMVTTIFKRGKL